MKTWENEGNSNKIIATYRTPKYNSMDEIGKIEKQSQFSLISIGRNCVSDIAI